MSSAVDISPGGTRAATAAVAPERTTRPQRLLVAWLPAFRLERCGWEARDKVALVAPEKNAMRVQALTPGASKLGIRRGMGAAEARALVPEIAFEVFEEREPADEVEDLTELSRLLRVLSPRVWPLTDHRDAIAVDLSDTLELLGGEAACLDRVVHVLGDVGHRSRVVIVDGDRVGADRAARALACHHDRHQVIEPGGLAPALSVLPIETLRPTLRLEEGLRAVGVRTLGQLARLSGASVACRYGSEGLELLQLARADPSRALSDTFEPSEREATDGPSARVQLPAPAVCTDAVHAVLDRLLERLCLALQATEQAAVRIQLRLVLEDAADVLLSIRLGRPRRDPATLGTLVRRRLEDLRMEAPVVEVGLEILESCPYHGRQHGLLDRSEALEPLDELLARLEDALGEQSLLRAVEADVHRPEAGWEAATFTVHGPSELLSGGRPVRLATSARPALMLPDPRPVRVQLDPRSQPEAVEVEGRWRRTWSTEGPERLAGEWWTSDPFERDYYRVALADGRQPWIFLDRETGDWWLHGWF